MAYILLRRPITQGSIDVHGVVLFNEMTLESNTFQRRNFRGDLNIAGNIIGLPGDDGIVVRLYDYETKELIEEQTLEPGVTAFSFPGLRGDGQLYDVTAQDAAQTKEIRVQSKVSPG